MEPLLAGVLGLVIYAVVVVLVGYLIIWALSMISGLPDVIPKLIWVLVAVLIIYKAITVLLGIPSARFI